MERKTGDRREIRASKNSRISIGDPSAFAAFSERLGRSGASLLLAVRAQARKSGGPALSYVRIGEPFPMEAAFNEWLGEGRFWVDLSLVWVVFDAASLRSSSFAVASPDGYPLPAWGGNVEAFAEGILRCESEILAWREADLLALASGPAPAAPKKSRSL